MFRYTRAATAAVRSIEELRALLSDFTREILSFLVKRYWFFFFLCVYKKSWRLQGVPRKFTRRDISRNNEDNQILLFFFFF